MTDKKEVPEKIYFNTSRRAIEYIKWAGLDKKEPSDDIEYIRADLVEPSYGAEMIIRGNGKRQDEYILKSVADKRVDDAIKPIVEVYEKYKKIDDELFYINNLPSYPKFAVELINNLWQAIKATVKQFKDEEKAD